jgi:hypothetical protein
MTHYIFQGRLHKQQKEQRKTVDLLKKQELRAAREEIKVGPIVAKSG